MEMAPGRRRQRRWDFTTNRDVAAVAGSRIEPRLLQALVAAVSNCVEECLATGGRWVHLRLCQECGHVGCCDNSPGRHATKHFHASQHAIMRSFEPGEDWSWCYVDELFFEPAVRPG